MCEDDILFKIKGFACYTNAGYKIKNSPLIKKLRLPAETAIKGDFLFMWVGDRAS